MDDQTRTHCIVDLDKVRDGVATADWFLRKWGRELREGLRTRTLNEERIRDAENESDEAEAARSRLESVARDAAKDLERIADGNDASSIIGDKIAAIAERLEQATT